MSSGTGGAQCRRSSIGMLINILHRLIQQGLGQVGQRKTTKPTKKQWTHTPRMSALVAPLSSDRSGLLALLTPRTVSTVRSTAMSSSERGGLKSGLKIAPEITERVADGDLLCLQKEHLVSLYDRVFYESDEDDDPRTIKPPPGHDWENPARAKEWNRTRFTSEEHKRRLADYTAAEKKRLAAGGHPLEGGMPPHRLGTPGDPQGMKRGGRVRQRLG